MATAPAARPLHREIRLLVGALIVFLITLIVALLALAVSILRMDRLAVTADATARVVSPLIASASREDMRARLEALGAANGIGRIEIYRGPELWVDTGRTIPSAEVLTREIPGGRMLFFFEVSNFAGGRRSALVVGALATIATMAGLLIFILYIPKFLRPVEEMLAQAQRLAGNPRGDHDARYLVHTFREAVERIQQQSQEIDQLRTAATSHTPDLAELARALNRSFSSGFAAIDANGTILAINDAGRSILGISGEPALDAVPPSFATIVRQSLESREAFTRREVLIEQSESLIGVTTVPLFDEQRFLGLFALFTDLTTFRAMEARMRDLENLIGLGQMSAGIAHEFRNSLFTILGYLQLAQRTAAEEPAAKIRNAEQEAKKLAGAVDALLNFARPLKIRSQRIRFDEIVGSVIEHFRTEAADVRFSLESAPVEINGDRELLERAFENIVRNAVDAVRQRHPDGGGSVDTTIALEPHPVIIVRDNGVGVDAEQATAYLLPFQSGKPHGFGLGLPLARKIILHHGGTLALSGAVGEGACVRIEFFS
ncbi:MAG TPA: ATP-binding protein [Thermoanaerobaculia bacterium]|nr:ATP-binding protein [Thermoanaerobaculia bacterium]